MIDSSQSLDGAARRDFLRRAGSLALGAFGWRGLRLLGLGAATTSAASCARQRSQQDLIRRLVIGITDEIKTLDPAYQVMALDGAIMANIQENLTWYNTKLNLRPRLAESWETPDNGRTWIFHLRKGVKFHDGTAFDAGAVKFHFDRIKNPQTASTRITRIKFLEATEVVDAHTVRFRMNTPFSMWPEELASPFGCIVCPSAVRAAGGKNYARRPAGTGPFIFVEWLPDRHVLLRRNPSYWQGQIKLEEVMYRPVREATTRLIMLERGDLDMVDIFWGHTDVARQSGRIIVDTVPMLAIRYIGLNNQKPPFDDARVRRAANYAINRDYIVKYAFRGNADPSFGPVPPALPSFNNQMRTYDYNPGKARDILRQAGYGGGVEVTLWAADSASDRLLAETILEQLREAGINVRVMQFDSAVYWDKFDAYITNDGKWYPRAKGVFDMFIGGWVGGENAFGYIDPLFRSTSNSNTAFYVNAAVDKMLDEALSTTDEAARAELFRKLQALIVDDAPWIFTYHSRITMGINRRVKGWITNPAGYYELENVLLEADAQS